MNSLDQKSSKEIEIKKIVEALKKRFWIIILFTLAAGGAGFAYFEHTKPTLLYEASSTVIIQEENVNMETLKVLVKEPIVLEQIITELELNQTAESLSQHIIIEDINSSQVIRFTAIDTTPDKAVSLANTTANIFPEAVNNTLGYNNMEVLSEATVDQSQHPINVPSNRMIYGSIIIGLITGVGMALLLDSLDNKLKSVREVETLLETPVLGTVSKVSRRTTIQKKEKRANLSKRSETIG